MVGLEDIILAIRKFAFMFPLSKKHIKIKKRMAPMDGHIVSNIIGSIEKETSQHDSFNFIAFFQDKNGVKAVSLAPKDMSFSQYDGQHYSNEVIDSKCAQLCFWLIYHESLGGLKTIRKHRRKKLLALGVSFPVDVAGTIMRESSSHEVVVRMVDKTEMRVLISDGSMVCGTTTFDHGNLFSSEKIDGLHFSLNNSETLGALVDVLTV